jgi:dTDP-glucose 4,6-dehydratase
LLLFSKKGYFCLASNEIDAVFASIESNIESNIESTMSKKVLITGGAGFIGSHVVRRFVNNYPDYEIYNLDVLTYAGNLENITDVEQSPNYTFLKGDITDEEYINEIFASHRFDAVIHLAAESHVDRSIEHPLAFAKTNILGTMTLLNAFKNLWRDSWSDKVFYHVSTDEVYGSLGETGLFTETTAYDPNSPYSASKASSDHFVRAYGETYGMPYVITNCSNNYGPNQFPEKLIPLFINNILTDKPLPVYGDGNYTRDWLYVIDHAVAIDLVFHKGKNHETYNIGGFNEWKNIDLIKVLCKLMDEKLGADAGTAEQLITYVKDRPGHDLRYAIDANKISNDLGWKPSVTFEEGLSQSIDWYLENKDWLNNVTSGTYADYYSKQYS